MAHLQKHGSLTRTAEALFVHITTVQNWLNRFSREGLAGLQEKPQPGRANKAPVWRAAQNYNHR